MRKNARILQMRRIEVSIEWKRLNVVEHSMYKYRTKDSLVPYKKISAHSDIQIESITSVFTTSLLMNDLTCLNNSRSQVNERQDPFNNEQHALTKTTVLHCMTRQINI